MSAWEGSTDMLYYAILVRLLQSNDIKCMRSLF